MAITELLKLPRNSIMIDNGENQKKESDYVYDSVRRVWLKKKPEEIIRQNLLHILINKLGFPAQLCVVEKKLSSLCPHQLKVPFRRIDIVCFASFKAQNTLSTLLYPLLMIECKATRLNKKSFEQVIGYNQYLQAPFICLANQETIQTGWYDPSLKNYHFQEGIPQYSDLLGLYSYLNSQNS